MFSIAIIVERRRELMVGHSARSCSAEVRATQGGPTCRSSQTPLRLGKTDHSGFAFRPTNQFGPKRPVSKADLAERHPVHMSARRRDVRHPFDKLGYGFRCTQRCESIMGWPFTTAWATFSWFFLLISVGPTTFRRMPSPHHPARAAPSSSPLRSSTPAPTSGCRHRTRHHLSRPSRLIDGYS